MKYVYSFFFLFISYVSFGGQCCGACTANCISWCIEYTTDCGGNIETFTSIHWSGGYNFEVNTEETAPGWVGMSAASLDPDCFAEPCM